MSENLYHTLRGRFADHLDKPCLRLAKGGEWTYRDLDDLSARLAVVLRESAAAGDRLLMQVNKTPEAVALYLACLRTGLVLVPLNTAYTRSELDYFIGDAEPAIEVDDQRLKQLCAEAGSRSPLEDIHPAKAGDIAAILYTSGTTGRSKGAMLTHGNLGSNALTLHSLWGFEDGDVLLHALPIFHVHGLFVALNTALLNRSTILFLERFDLETVLAQLPDATVMMGVPTFYTRLLASPDFGPQHHGHMRLFISGSAPLTEQTFAEFEQRTGQKILERYGMSEAGMITSNPLQGERIAGTVGYALPGVEVRVCDEGGSTVPTGEVGIVEARGPNIFAGYWRMPEKTASEFRDDWFITGDLGSLSADGRLSLVGREKDLIISGGYNVYPKEVELCLDEIPGVAESAVIGVPHPDFGEAVIAVCVASEDALPDEDEISAELANKLARFKQPKRVIRVEELPRNTMGKVQKNLLRKQHAGLFAG
jgi:malonyl-CoA/methylmalonyl-CoA synthetase